MPSDSRFIDIINDSLTTEKLIDFLNKNYPDALPVWEYHCIYTLCSGNDRKKQRKLVHTLFEYYKNNPINIDEGLISMIIIHLHDYELIKYLSELCTYTDYAPVHFTQGILNNVCYHNLLDILKYIINLPTISHHYIDIMKNINITKLLFSVDPLKDKPFDIIFYLIKYSKNNKNTYTSYTLYTFYDEEDDVMYDIVNCYNNEILDKVHISIGIHFGYSITQHNILKNIYI